MRAVIKWSGIICVVVHGAFGQVQTDYHVHKRGMLNQAVYKTGALGRVAYQNSGTTEPGVPSFEPSSTKTYSLSTGDGRASNPDSSFLTSSNRRGSRFSSL